MGTEMEKIHTYIHLNVVFSLLSLLSPPPSLPLFLPQGEYKAQKEAVWAITNLTAGGSIEQVGF